MPASPTRVLVTHELTSYAEALATFLAHCCPDIEVRCLSPLELEAAVLADPGAIAVIDRLTPSITAHAGGWLALIDPDTEVVVAPIKVRPQHDLRSIEGGKQHDGQ